MILLKIAEKRNVSLLVHTLTSLMAFFYGLKVVGIPIAATIKESFAFLALEIEKKARHQSSAWPRLILQMTWTLVL